MPKSTSSKRTTTHEHYDTRLHRIWTNMKTRCYNKNNSHYCRYGGERGIIVCEEWKIDFEAFYDWALANGYADDLTIERNDNDGNYEPSNCKWTTMNEQCHNRGIKASNTSGSTGVSWRNDRNKWRAIIWNDKKLIYLGLFDTIEEATAARHAAEKKYWNKE